jgi:hypothetical protein
MSAALAHEYETVYPLCQVATLTYQLKSTLTNEHTEMLKVSSFICSMSQREFYVLVVMIYFYWEDLHYFVFED